MTVATDTVVDFVDHLTEALDDHEATGEELAALEQATIVPDGARQARAPLAGPTLDDVMSRAWEGLVMGLSAACPVCDGEVVPSSAGSVPTSWSSASRARSTHRRWNPRSARSPPRSTPSAFGPRASR